MQKGGSQLPPKTHQLRSIAPKDVWSTPERLDPFCRGFVSEGLDHSDRWVDCDAVTRVSNASYHLAIVASGALLDLELSEQSSSMGKVVSFPPPSGEH